VLEYLEASRAAESEAQAEAQAQIAERTAALERAEAAAAREREAQAAVAVSQRRFRNVSYAAVVGSSLLALLALGLGYTALNTSVWLIKRSSQLYAADAEMLIRNKRYADAMLVALHGDPGARGQWETRLLRPSVGFEKVQEVLQRAYALKTNADGRPDSISGLPVTEQVKRACENLLATGIPKLSKDAFAALEKPLNAEPCKGVWPRQAKE
jgi:hypothetical protein